MFGLKGMDKRKTLGVLHGFRVFLAGTNPDDLIHRGDEDFTVTDFARAASGDDLIYHQIHLIIVDNDFDFEFLEKLYGVFRTTIALGLTFLAAETSNFGNCHAYDAGINEGNFHFVELKGTNDRFYFFQACDSLFWMLS